MKVGEDERDVREGQMVFIPPNVEQSGGPDRADKWTHA
jgi:mannose-6-phosphate isomerase-like protein (cupin superfamily)